MSDLREEADKIITFVLNNVCKETISISSGSIDSVKVVLREIRNEALEEAAKKVEAFVHTRRDCEAGTTVEEIAEDIRGFITSSAKDE